MLPLRATGATPLFRHAVTIRFFLLFADDILRYFLSLSPIFTL